MVSLTLMARLLEAVRPDARLILVGDPDQLSSVEAGAVLADIAGAPTPPDGRTRTCRRPAGAGTGRRDAERWRGAWSGSATRGGSAGPSTTWPGPSAHDDADGPSPCCGPDDRRAVRARPTCEATARPGCTPLVGAGVGRPGPTCWSAAAGRRRAAALRRPGAAPAALRPPARTVRCGPVGPRDGALAGRATPGYGDGGRVVRRAAVAGDRQRLRAQLLQRRHRGGGRHR